MKAKLLFSLTLCFSFLFANATTTTIIDHDPVGTYEFTVTDIPDQADVKGEMIVAKTDGVVTVTFTSSAGDASLSDVKLDGHKLTGKLEMQGIILKLSGTFSGDKFEGQWNTEFGALPITAAKK